MASFIRTTFDNIVNNINNTLSPNHNSATNRAARNTSRASQQPTNTYGPQNSHSSRNPNNSRPNNNTASDYIRIIRRNIAPFSGGSPRSNEQTARSSSQPPTGRTRHRQQQQHDPNCPAHRHCHQHNPPVRPPRHTSVNDMSSNVSQDNAANARPTAVEKLDITDVHDPGDINTLTAKQLKIILTRNCVDFKGVFEKEVLREKVLQLWIDCNEKRYNKSNSNQNNMSGGNDGSQQNSDDIDESQACKICMEREINCVLLECGHMLTCVTCGRKLAECPICRQNVSRCVRTFRG